MVKIMYKEVAKSQKSAIGPAILWVVFMYAFYILWGIGEILLEIKTPLLLKHLILWGLTGWFGWILISRFITEYEFAARKNEFTVTKTMSKRSSVICSVKYESMEDIIFQEDKSRLKSMKISKKHTCSPAFYIGKKVHLVYMFDGKRNAITMIISRNMISLLKEKMLDAKGENK